MIIPVSRVGSSKKGLAVDWIDTRTLAVRQLEPPREEAVEYITDGHGTVRIMGMRSNHGNFQDTGVIRYLYRVQGSSEWQKLGDSNELEGRGFSPYAVDHDLNIAYGFKKKDGRLALYSVALDGSLRENLVFARADVDVDRLIRIGRRKRVVGFSYATDVRVSNFLDPSIEKLMGVDFEGRAPAAYTENRRFKHGREQVAGIRRQRRRIPGVYYIFDRTSRVLQTFLVARRELEGVKLASVRSVTYPASDGVMIPGYLTLPPDRENARGLPAIVLPHGGPSARDEWGFDWLSQFYASRGFAVLQPNFRGSSGYGDAWFQQNGFPVLADRDCRRTCCRALAGHGGYRRSGKARRRRLVLWRIRRITVGCRRSHALQGRGGDRAGDRLTGVERRASQLVRFRSGTRIRGRRAAHARRISIGARG